MECRFAFVVDSETTGIFPLKDPACNQVIEIASAIVDLNLVEIVSRYHALIRPTLPMSEFSAKNFKGETWERAVDEKTAMAGLIAHWRTEVRAPYTGQMPIFDLDHFRPIVKRHELSWPDAPEVDYHVHDVASMCLPHVRREKIASTSLKHTRLWANGSELVCRKFGRAEGEQLHRAQGDVLDTIRVLVAVLEAA